MTAGTCTTPTLCVGSLAVAPPEQRWPRPTSVTVQVPSCWTTWHAAAMNPACTHASTWAGVSTIVAIMKMPELSVIVRPKFTMSTYTMLSTGTQHTSVKVTNSTKTLLPFHPVVCAHPCWDDRLQCMTWVLRGGGVSESIKNTVHESRHISVTACLQAKFHFFKVESKAHRDSALLSTSLGFEWS